MSVCRGMSCLRYAPAMQLTCICIPKPKLVNALHCGTEEGAQFTRLAIIMVLTRKTYHIMSAWQCMPTELSSVLDSYKLIRQNLHLFVPHFWFITYCQYVFQDQISLAVAMELCSGAACNW